jgi:hypothetical protein
VLDWICNALEFIPSTEIIIINVLKLNERNGRHGSGGRAPA